VVATTAHLPTILQPDSEQRPFKLVFPDRAMAAEVLPQLESLLQKQGLDIKLIYGTGQDLVPRIVIKV